MAGLGYKVFTAGEVLTAANVNGYLMDQSVMVFADSSARSSAIGTPSQGMVSYLTDTSSLEVYGTAWAAIGGGGGGGGGAIGFSAPSTGGSFTVSIGSGVYGVQSDASFPISVGTVTISDSSTQVIQLDSDVTNLTFSDFFSTWTSRNGQFGTSEVSAMYFGNDLFVAGGAGGRLTTSTDGITWTARSSGISTTIRFTYFGNSLWIYGGENGNLRTSTDAITWTARSSNFGSSRVYTGVYGNGFYAIGGDGGTVATSTDGTSWTTRSSGVATALFGSASNGSIVVMGGSSGTVITSGDGINWTTRDAGFGSGSISCGLYANSQFILGGANGTISVSTDGITWTSRSTAVSSQIRNLDYYDNYYLASGDQNAVQVSTDSITWSSRTAAGAGAFYAQAAGANIYVIAGIDGVFLTAENDGSPQFLLLNSASMTTLT